MRLATPSGFASEVFLLEKPDGSLDWPVWLSRFLRGSDNDA